MVDFSSMMSAISRSCFSARFVPFTTFKSCMLPKSCIGPRTRFFSSSSFLLKNSGKKSPQSAIISQSRKAPEIALAHKSLKAPVAKAFSKPSAKPYTSPGINFSGSYSNPALGLNPTPTVLYQASNHNPLFAASYIAGAFCFGYAYFFCYHYWVNPPEGLHWLVPYAYGGITIFMGGIGCYFFGGPMFLVKRITAIPSAGQTLLEVQVRSSFPIPERLLPGPTILAKPTQVQLRQKVSFWDDLSVLERRTRERAIMDKAIAAEEYEKAHRMTRPLRSTGRALRGFFNGMKRLFAHNWYANLVVDGFRYKLDIAECMLLDQGRALEKMVAIRGAPE